MIEKIKRYFSEEEKEERKLKKLKDETRKRKVAESVYKDLSTEYYELKEKYIKLLEDKSDKFDKLIEYQELYKTQESQIKEYKREISDLKSELKESENQLEEISLKYEELEKTLTNSDKAAKIITPKEELQREIEEKIYGKK